MGLIMIEINNKLLREMPPSFRRDFKIGLHLSQSNPIENKSRHSCIIRFKNKIIGCGVNKTKTHPLQAKYKNHPDQDFLHAEIDAIVDVINKHGSSILSECEMIVIRTYKDHTLASSKPCPGCKKAIEAFDIPKVYHT